MEDSNTDKARTITVCLQDAEGERHKLLELSPQTFESLVGDEPNEATIETNIQAISGFKLITLSALQTEDQLALPDTSPEWLTAAESVCGYVQLDKEGGMEELAELDSRDRILFVRLFYSAAELFTQDLLSRGEAIRTGQEKESRRRELRNSLDQIDEVRNNLNLLSNESYRKDILKGLASEYSNFQDFKNSLEATSEADEISVGYGKVAEILSIEDFSEEYPLDEAEKEDLAYALSRVVKLMSSSKPLETLRNVKGTFEQAGVQQFFESVLEGNSGASRPEDKNPEDSTPKILSEGLNRWLNKLDEELAFLQTFLFLAKNHEQQQSNSKQDFDRRIVRKICNLFRSAFKISMMRHPHLYLQLCEVNHNKKDEDLDQAFSLEWNDLKKDEFKDIYLTLKNNCWRNIMLKNEKKFLTAVLKALDKITIGVSQSDNLMRKKYIPSTKAIKDYRPSMESQAEQDSNQEASPITFPSLNDDISDAWDEFDSITPEWTEEHSQNLLRAFASYCSWDYKPPPSNPDENNRGD